MLLVVHDFTLHGKKKVPAFHAEDSSLDFKDK